MPPIGETLREARLRQKIDVADVEEATKIRAKYLRALEGEEFDRLPGGTFVRTFIRTYADFLGLDSQLLVEEYRARHERTDEVEPAPLAPPPSTRPRTREPRRRAPTTGAGRPSRATMIAGGALAILVALILLGLLVGESPEDDGARPAATKPGGGGKGAGGGGAAESNTVKLEITPSAETYVCVENTEGKELLNATITERETVEGRTLLLNLGNTLGLELRANGDPVALEESPNPVGLELTPEGQEDLPAGQRPCQ